MDLHVDVGRSEDLPVAVPDARPRQPSLALLGHHSEAATAKIINFVFARYVKN